MADFNRFITGNDIIRRVLTGMGLPAPVSAAESLNATDRQLWALLTEVGQDIVDEEHQWQILTKTYTINTTPGVLEYSLPDDFQYFVDSTGWNRTARIPLIGPLSSQQWNLLLARQLGGTTLRMQYVIEAGKVRFYFVPDDSNEITLEYQSRGWVQDAADSNVFRDNMLNSGDICLFAPRLMIAGLKRRWKIAKGFDATADDEEYQRALDAAKYDDRPKNDLGLNTNRGYPYLGPLNMPDTGYGV